VFFAAPAVRAIGEAQRAETPGDSVLDWKPYGNDIRLIAQAAAAEKSLFYRELPVADGLLEALLTTERNDVPVLILIDVVALMSPEATKLLGKILRYDLANCAMVLVWTLDGVGIDPTVPEIEAAVKSLASVAASVRTEEDLKSTLATTIDRIRLRLISKARLPRPVVGTTPLPKLR
jgi:hypothetical protein